MEMIQEAKASVACLNKFKLFPQAILVMNGCGFYYCIAIAPVFNQLLASSACRILVLQLGIELVSLALQGRFLTTGPPGKFQVVFLMNFILYC